MMTDLHLIKAEIAEFLHGLAERYGLGTSEIVQVLRLIISDLNRSL